MNSRGQASLWIAVKALAWKHDCELVNGMRKIRDEAKSSTKFRQLCESPSIGTAGNDTSMSAQALSLLDSFPKQFRQQLDEQVFTRLLLMTANAVSDHFRESVQKLLPDAEYPPGHNSNIPQSAAHKPLVFFVPVKGLERTMVKYREYAAENHTDVWPVTTQIKDTLRCTIDAPDGDAFAAITNKILLEYDVREGHGRLKNNLEIEKHQPPNVLTNVVMPAPAGMEPQTISAEIQIFLRGIDEMNEHKYYEARG